MVVEHRLLRRFPDLAPGVVVATVGRAARQHSRGGWPREPSWSHVEQAAEEQLMLRQLIRPRTRGAAGKKAARSEPIMAPTSVNGAA